VHGPSIVAKGHLVDTFAVDALSRPAVTVGTSQCIVETTRSSGTAIIRTRIAIVAIDGTSHALPGLAALFICALVGVVAGAILEFVNAFSVGAGVGGAFESVIAMVRFGAGNAVSVHTHHIAIARLAAIAPTTIVATDLAVTFRLTDAGTIGADILEPGAHTTLSPAPIITTVSAAAIR